LTALSWQLASICVNAAECRFGYRDSIFKHEYQDRFAIVAVGLRLPKQWQPVLTYGDLTRLDPQPLRLSRFLIPSVICA
jgi:UDP-N-acetylenolpyruvoylglucosamine reductase